MFKNKKKVLSNQRKIEIIAQINEFHQTPAKLNEEKNFWFNLPPSEFDFAIQVEMNPEEFRYRD